MTHPTPFLGGDDRAGACVVLNAILEILRQGLPHPPLTLLWPVQEEIGLQGVRHVSVKGLGNPKLSFNWDGGPPNMAVIGAVGHTHMDIAIDGIASHAGGHPELGVNAAVVAAMAVADLQENGWHGLVQQGKNRGSSNVGIFHGGDATNVVMPRVTLQAEARSHKAAFRDRIVREYKKAFERAAKAVTSADGGKPRLTFETDIRYEALRLPKSEACVVSALQAVDCSAHCLFDRIVSSRCRKTSVQQRVGKDPATAFIDSLVARIAPSVSCSSGIHRRSVR